MNTQTLRRIEGAKMGLVKVLEKALRRTPNDHEVRELLDLARKDWNGWYARLNRVLSAAAQKRDKGVVLFTIFLPNGSGLKHVTRTPNRCISGTERRAWYQTEDSEPHVDVRSMNGCCGWLWDFAYHLEAGRRYAMSEHAAEARSANMPAWAKAVVA